jgi:tetratricopeptide (TPR) repeat protein/antitoxin component YwqK of YwqJK toxin-antitoxin module
MERVSQDYAGEGVEVVYVVSGCMEVHRRQDLPRFKDAFKISYMVLDDRSSSVRAVCLLDSDTRTPVNLIIDRSGIVRHIGESTPWTKLEEELEILLGESTETDLSSPEKGIRALAVPGKSPIRWKAADALAEMREPAAVAALIEALSDESGTVREAAANALGKIGDREAGLPLSAALEDRLPFVRLAAARALKEIKDARAISPLLKFLMEPELAQTAVETLAVIHRPEALVKALEENRDLLRSSDREGAGRSLARLAASYDKAGAYHSAIAAYREAEELTAGSVTSRACVENLARCYVEIGEYCNAVPHYLNRIQAASPTRISAHVTHENGTSDSFTEREWRVREMVDLYAKHDRLNELAAILDSKRGDLPEDAVLLEVSAHVYDRLGRKRNAAAMYEKLLELNPENPRHSVRLASAYLEAGATEEAAAALDTIDETGLDVAVLELLGRALFQCGKRSRAIAVYERVIERACTAWERRRYEFGLARGYGEAGEHAEAAALYENIARSPAATRDPEIADRLLWELYEDNDLYGFAAEKYRKMVKENPDDAKANEYLARAYEGQGLAEQAATMREKAGTLAGEHERGPGEISEKKNDRDLEKPAGITDRDRDGWLGPVRTVTAEKALFGETSGEWVEEDRETTQETSYDAKGRRTSYVSFFSGGSPRQRSTYTSGAARTETIEFYREDGSLRDRSSTTFDETGRRVKSVTEFSPPNRVGLEKEVAVYDGQGRLAEQISYDPDGAIRDRSVNVYDRKGRIREQANFNGDGSLGTRSVSAHDDDGMLIEEAIYRADGSPASLHVFGYDPTGNEIKNVTYTVTRLDGRRNLFTFNGATLRKVNASGRITEETTYRSDGSPQAREVTEYDDQGKHTHSEDVDYDEEGSAVSRYVGTYDDTGHMREFACYGVDGTVLYKQLYTFDQDGKRSSKEFWTNDSLFFRRTITVTYSPEGRPQEEITYHLDNSVDQRKRYLYDEKGNKTGEAIYGPDGSLETEFAYSRAYDSYGNLIKTTTWECITEEGKPRRLPREVTYQTITFHSETESP